MSTPRGPTPLDGSCTRWGDPPTPPPSVLLCPSVPTHQPHASTRFPCPPRGSPALLPHRQVAGASTSFLEGPETDASRVAHYARDVSERGYGALQVLHYRRDGRKVRTRVLTLPVVAPSHSNGLPCLVGALSRVDVADPTDDPAAAAGHASDSPTGARSDPRQVRLALLYAIAALLPCPTSLPCPSSLPAPLPTQDKAQAQHAVLSPLRRPAAPPVSWGSGREGPAGRGPE